MRFAARAEGVCGADERTRTADLLITSELLYQLSYVGLAGPVLLRPVRARNLAPGSPCCHQARPSGDVSNGPFLKRFLSG